MIGAVRANSSLYVVGQRVVSGALWYQVASEDGLIIGWLPAADIQVIMVFTSGNALDQLPVGAVPDESPSGTEDNPLEFVPDETPSTLPELPVGLVP